MKVITMKTITILYSIREILEVFNTTILVKLHHYHKTWQNFLECSIYMLLEGSSIHVTVG